MLRDIKCHNQNIFMVAETTCPVRKRQMEDAAAADRLAEDFKTVKTVHDLGLPDCDVLEATEPVPEWLQQEFIDSEENNNGQQRLKTPQRGQKLYSQACFLYKPGYSTHLLQFPAKKCNW